ncbi:MAG: hypothetical protein U0931_29045 [Vulcanimicrobiota bacterium]
MTVMDNPEGRRALLGACEKALDEMNEFNEDYIHSSLYAGAVVELRESLNQLADLPVTQLRDANDCPACGQPITRMDHYGLKSVSCDHCLKPISQALDKIIRVVEFGDE